MSDYWAACFDLDGTLIDTEPVHLRAETSCLITLEIDTGSLRHERTFGKGIESGMKSLAETYELDYELVMATHAPMGVRTAQRPDGTTRHERHTLLVEGAYRVDGAGDIR
jgi:beta-phosphoglucomutase-like phosphatase (HAD superfamily)